VFSSAGSDSALGMELGFGSSATTELLKKKLMSLAAIILAMTEHGRLARNCSIY